MLSDVKEQSLIPKHMVLYVQLSVVGGLTAWKNNASETSLQHSDRAPSLSYGPRDEVEQSLKPDAVEWLYARCTSLVLGVRCVFE